MLLLEKTKFEKNNINVIYEIDYYRKTISILDNSINNKNKQYIFVGRGIEYMKGWYNILDVLKEAIQEAEGKLRVFIEREEKENLKQLIKISETLNDEDDEVNLDEDIRKWKYKIK